MSNLVCTLNPSPKMAKKKKNRTKPPNFILENIENHENHANHAETLLKRFHLNGNKGRRFYQKTPKFRTFL